MSNNKTKHRKRMRRQIGIKWKMFAILICFVFVFAVMIWVFQIYMLNFFYQNARFNELEDINNELSDSFDGDDSLVQIYSEEYGDEYNCDIWIYKIEDGNFDINLPIVYSNGTKDPFGPLFESHFKEMYNGSVQNDGVYIVVASVKKFKGDFVDFKIVKDNAGDASSFPFVSDSIRDMTVMYSGIHRIDGVEYLIIQRANISPVGTIIKTLENQVLFVGVSLILVSFVLAFSMSKLITTPIVQVNNLAKNLAVGRYDAEFAVHGYREIEELSETLNFASKELSKNDELQKELIANVSHDLRTPLTMIKGYSEVMRDIPDENTPENLQVVIDEAERLTELVNDMFDLSKIRSGTRHPQIKCFCLTESVRETLQRYDKLVSQSGYKIDFFANENVYVCADYTMILQVIYNLINNAVNYSGEDKYISVTQSSNGNIVRISVSDNGDGISKEDIPFIWDRYYKVDKLHKRATVGTGLGLSIVKGILELHNATYGVTSAQGAGATFWFELKTADGKDDDCVKEWSISDD